MPDAGPVLCLHCGSPTGDSREFHDACWPEAKAHLDAVVAMARRKFGQAFSVIVDSAGGVPTVQPILGGIGVGVGVVSDEPLEGPPQMPVGRREDAEPEFIPSPCLCHKDADGRCPGCIEAICAYVKGVIETQKEFGERISKLKDVSESCDACAEAYADFSLARIINDMFRPVLEDVGEEFRPTIMALADAMKAHYAGKGVRAWPLSDKAIRDILWGPEAPA